MEINNVEEERGMFFTLGATSLPVPLAPKSFQVWRETTQTQTQTPTPPTPPPPAAPSDSNLTVLESSAGEKDGESSSGPKKLGFINYEVEPGLTIRLRQNIDHEMDPRKLKRVISNRVSAQKSRIKKLQYIAELEMKHKKLEMQVVVLRPQVAIAREHKQFVEMEQRELNLRIAACQEHFRRTEGEIEAKKIEIRRLMRELGVDQEEGYEGNASRTYSLLHPNANININL